MKKREQAPTYYPIFLNISGRRCVVVGGGQVALRKVKALLEHGANVDIISPALCPELTELSRSGKIQVLHREYREGDLKDALVTIAATDNSDVNLKLAEDGRKHTTLVNVVDDANNSDFIAPSYLRCGDVTIAISTGGRSPALARKIRTRLEKDFDAEFASLTQLISEVRDEIKQRGIKVDAEVWQAALDLDLLADLLRRGDSEQTRAVLLHNLKISQATV
ncbi:bifunctional precorrin-2 dehydrogenase/sirohydrochlorin ferrochelatase [Chloroflexota bacterium]